MTSPENAQEIPDFSGFTCTTLMIRLKMLLKKAPPGSVVEIIVRRDQRDTIEVPFSRTGYDVKIRKSDNNLFRVRLQKQVSVEET
jgi:TusA-related sulfurtransferase